MPPLAPNSTPALSPEDVANQGFKKQAQDERLSVKPEDIDDYVDHLVTSGQGSYEDANAYGNHLRSAHNLPQRPINEDQAQLYAIDKFARHPIDSALRLLNIPGGTIRTALSAMAGRNGVPGQMTDEDIATKGLSGTAPSTSELLARGGAGEMGHLSGLLPLIPKGSPLDITGRGALGLVGDITTDPASYAPAIGEKGAELIGEAGQGMYRSGLKKLDQAAARYGKGPNAISDLLLNVGNGISGSMSSIGEKVRPLIDSLTSRRDGLLKMAQDAAPSPQRVVQGLQDFIEAAAKSRDPGRQRVAAALQPVLDEHLDALKGKPEIPEIPPQTVKTQVPGQFLDETGKPIMIDGEKTIPGVPGTPEVPNANILDLQGNKSTLGNATPSSAFRTTNEVNLFNRGLKKLAGGYKDEIERSAEEVTPGAGSQIAGTNDALGKLLTVRKAVERAAESEGNKNMFTSVDGMLLHRPEIAAMKKAADISKGTWFRTGAGKNLYNAGNSAWLPQLLNQSVLQDARTKNNEQ